MTKVLAILHVRYFDKEGCDHYRKIPHADYRAAFNEMIRLCGHRASELVCTFDDEYGANFRLPGHNNIDNDDFYIIKH